MCMHVFIYPFPTTLLLLLTCFIVVGRKLVQHFTIHSQDALLEDAGVRESALSLLSLKGLQLLLQAFWQVGLHIVSCSLGRGDDTGIAPVSVFAKMIVSPHQ